MLHDFYSPFGMLMPFSNHQRIKHSTEVLEAETLYYVTCQRTVASIVTGNRDLHFLQSNI